MAQRTGNKRGRARQKRGVVLLIVVTLLTLFIMIGITLALLASNYKNAGEELRAAGTYGDLPEKEMDLARDQLLFGGQLLTPISSHNLLADLWGHDSINGTVQAFSSLNGNQILNLTVTFTTTAEKTTDYYSGRVFTFLTGNARGISSHVLGYRYDANSGLYYLAVDVPESELPVAPTISVGDQFLINGGAFNGTGAGFRNADDSAPMAWAGMARVRPAPPDSDHLDAFMYFENLSPGQPPIGLPVALLPNYYGYPQKPAIVNFANGSLGPTELAINLGGMDENYDAPDYQNMFLAMIPPSLGQGNGAANRGQIVLLPSFHRPELVQMWFNYMMNDPGILGNVNATPQAKLELLRYPNGRNGIRELSGGDDEAAISFMNVPATQRNAIIAVKRSVIFRPLREDHPNFSGSNLNFEPDRLTNVEDTLNFGNGNAPAAYDVDNDGDGIADSIWIDPGLPMVTARDGRKYKRLFAFLVQDLDNRINVNAHGNMAPVLIPAAQGNQPITGNYEFAGQPPGGMVSLTMPRGLGCGPAEVDFRHIFSYNNNIYRSLFEGYAALNIPGRYGPDGGNPLAGFPNADDILSQAKNIGLPQNHTTTRSSFTSPPDVWGRGAMALDYYGMPLWVNATGVGSAETVDDPYEMQADWRRASADTPFAPGEMEALLRYNDPGSQGLYSRLLSNPLLRTYLGSSSPGAIGADNRLRALISTMGSHIPAPPMQIPKELRQSYQQYRLNQNQYAFQNWPASTSLIDLYAYRLLAGGVAQANLENELAKIVPFEIRHGQLLNINREFGNGVHDGLTTAYPAPLPLPEDTYGVVDDPGESYRNLDPMNAPNYNPREKIWAGTWQYSFEHENDLPAPIPLVPGYPPYNPMGMPPQYIAYPDVRQIMARHLYCLMMLLRDQTQNLDTDGDGVPNTPQETARMIAQLAINMVDFRDADAICSGFEYDENPWNGWDVDGRLDTADVDAMGNPVPRGVVWGVERPELLIGETIAAHDRRTEDLANDDGSSGAAGTVANGDESFDQRLVPHGALFVELCNPWYDAGNNAYDHKAPELYSAVGGGAGVELHRINNQGSPVWRMLIVKGTLLAAGPQGDPDFPQPENWTANPPMTADDVERSVYFVLPPGPGNPRLTALPTVGHGTPYFLPASLDDPARPGNPRLTPVQPGRYAVIGGFDEEQPPVGGAPPHYITYFGRRTDAVEGGMLNLNTTRRIELWPELNSNNPQLRVMDNAVPGNNDFNLADVQPTVAIPIQNLSVSVPTGSASQPAYPAPTGLTVDNEPMYMPPLDKPLDTDPMLQQNTTTPLHRRIFLQRLANPLLAWNPVTNPYVTIDASDISMTAYNGVAVDTADPQIGMNPRRNFQTFQRGGPFPDNEQPYVGSATMGVPGYAAYNPALTRGYRNLWRRQEGYGNPTADSPNGDPSGTGPHYFSYELFHTLGYLNRRYWGPLVPAPYLNSTSGVAQGYVGAPYPNDREDMQPRAFSWLTHLDRPLTSPMELLMVSAVSPSQLLLRFQMQNSAAPLNNAYNPNNTAVPYQHLLNFFQTTTNATTSDAPNLCRIFDYMEAPSPYVGAERYYNPQTFQTGTGQMNTFRPPFCRESRFRDPGRININTIYDSAVWEAIAKTMPGMDPSNPSGQSFFISVMTSRQGYPGALLTVNPNYPSLFSHPFRSADSADMMPPVPSLNGIRHTAPNATLLRDDSPDPTTISPPLFLSNSTQAYEEAGRNPYFRYQGLQKVANMVTTRSNCFAVWITVGYFEVEQNPGGVDIAHPDGYRLGQEIGADSGNAVRHRMFSIIDRTIPAAYEPGKRHNTDKMILLRRYIE